MRLKDRHKPVKSYALHLPSGASFTTKTSDTVSFIQEESGEHPSRLFDILLADSGGATILGGITAPGREDMTRPRFNMREYAEKHVKNLPRFLPHQPRHYQRHFLHHFFNAAGVSALNRATRLNRLHYDANVMEETLKAELGDVALSQTLNTVFISSQSIHPQICPYNFTNIRPELLKDDAKMALRFPDVQIPLYKPIMASSAFPTVFPAYEISETGTAHIDCGQIDTGVVHFMMQLNKRLRRDRTLGYIRLGTGDDRRPIHPSRYNSMSTADHLRTRNLFRLPSVQAKAHTEIMMREMLGDESCFAFDESIYPDSTSGRRWPSDDILDTSPHQISLLREFTADCLRANRDAYLRMIEELVENRARGDAVDPGAGYGLRILNMPAYATQPAANHQWSDVSISFRQASNPVLPVPQKLTLFQSISNRIWPKTNSRSLH